MAEVRAVSDEGHMILIRYGVTFAIGIIGVLLSVVAQEVIAGEVGVITFVQGAVTLAHSQRPSAPAKFRDDVRFHDIIETQKESRTKALFIDDSVLTVGENSRIEITEFVFNPHDSMRSAIINLVGGKLRALVGKVFAESGSRFEIHTPTAVAAARGTYFVVWLGDTGRTGVANIGEHGRVEFTSHGATVILQAGEFSEEREDGPTVPVPFRMSGSDVFAEGPADVSTLVFLQDTIVGTDVKENLRVEIHGESMFSGGVGRPVGLLISPPSFPGGGALTPPAVISGAAGLRGAGAVIGSANTSGGGGVPLGGPPIVTGPIVLPPPRGGGNHGTP
jgi:hypothetical protein